MKSILTRLKSIYTCSLHIKLDKYLVVNIFNICISSKCFKVSHILLNFPLFILRGNYNSYRKIFFWKHACIGIFVCNWMKKKTLPIQVLINPQFVIWNIIFDNLHLPLQKSKVTTYEQMWSVMPPYLMESNEKGYQKVIEEKGKYAFILEGVFNEYLSQQKPCKTMPTGGLINNIDYGIAINRKRREELGYVSFNTLVWKKNYKYIIK